MGTPTKMVLSHMTWDRTDYRTLPMFPHGCILNVEVSRGAAFLMEACPPLIAPYWGIPEFSQSAVWQPLLLIIGSFKCWNRLPGLLFVVHHVYKYNVKAFSLERFSHLRSIEPVFQALSVWGQRNARLFQGELVFFSFRVILAQQQMSSDKPRWQSFIPNWYIIINYSMSFRCCFQFFDKKV